MKTRIGLTFIRGIFGMSMQDLAEKLNMGKQTISEWERMVLKISNKRVEQMSELFGVSKYFITKEVNEMDEISILLEIAKNKVMKIKERLNKAIEGE